MPKGLRRRHGGGERHFITCSGYQRMQFLASGRRRDVFLKILEAVRAQFDFRGLGPRRNAGALPLAGYRARVKPLSLALQVLLRSQRIKNAPRSQPAGR